MKIRVEMTEEHKACVRQIVQSGGGLKEVGAAFDCSVPTAARIVKATGITLKHGGPRAKMTVRKEYSKPREPVDISRAQDMADLYVAGESLGKIGVHYGITRERVRQILKAQFGFTRAQSGALKGIRHRALERDRSEAERREALIQQRLGISQAEYKHFLHIGRAMSKAGIGRDRQPLGGFISQRRNYRRDHGAGWALSFKDWWDIWQESGHWNDRGRGHGYGLVAVDPSSPLTKSNAHVVKLSEYLAPFLNYGKQAA